jgi:rubrerythrin
MLVSTAVNLLTAKVGITNEQIQTALAEELTKALERKSPGLKAESSATDSGDSGPDVLPTESNGDDTLGVESSEHGEAQGREPQASDHATLARAKCLARVDEASGKSPNHKAKDFDYDLYLQHWKCKHCGVTFNGLEYEELCRGQI